MSIGDVERLRDSNEPAPSPERVKMLEAVSRIIAGDREEQYGGPEDSFDAIARHWSAYMHGRAFDLEAMNGFTAGDVAAMMALVKIARLETGGLDQADTWMDLAGYAACGFEVRGLKAE